MTTSKQYSAHNDKVFLTKQSLPLNTNYEMIALIEGKVWYGAADSAYESMAIRARELGADV